MEPGLWIIVEDAQKRVEPPIVGSRICERRAALSIGSAEARIRMARAEAFERGIRLRRQARTIAGHTPCRLPPKGHAACQHDVMQRMVLSMSNATKRKVTLYLDEDVLRAARVRAARTDKRDSEVVEDALRSYLGFEAVERVWARSTLSEDDGADSDFVNPAGNEVELAGWEGERFLVSRLLPECPAAGGRALDEPRDGAFL